LSQALDIAYVLMVEEITSARVPQYEARQRVDDILLDPGARSRREDQQAMQRLMATSGFIRVPGQKL
jgi:hypothetical protein